MTDPLIASPAECWHGSQAPCRWVLCAGRFEPIASFRLPTGPHPSPSLEVFISVLFVVVVATFVVFVVALLPLGPGSCVMSPVPKKAQVL